MGTQLTVPVSLWDKDTLTIPAYQTRGASGMDISSAEERVITLESLERRLFKTGIYAAVPEGYEIQVRPRGGNALNRGLTVLNTPGTVDSDYRGEIGVILINLSQEPQEIYPGERIAQLVLCPVARIEWYLVPGDGPLDAPVWFDTERGAGAFGSTGRM